jgi:hypothetical protein
MRNGKARKEIYFSSEEQVLLSDACKITGLDKTNTMRLLIHLGWRTLIKIPDNADNNTGIKMKPGTKRKLTDYQPGIPFIKK